MIDFLYDMKEKIQIYFFLIIIFIATIIIIIMKKIKGEKE
jgi:hypothetical protein